MRPIVQALNPIGTGPGAPIVIDQYISPDNVNFAVVLSSGASLTYSVEYSLDDPFASYAVNYNTNATWWPHPQVTAQTTSQQNVLGAPVRAIRTNVTTYASGSLVTTVLQAGVR